jgi:creatinine deaminase
MNETGVDIAELERHRAMLQVALKEARIGCEEGGVPVGAALFDGQGNLLGSGHNRRVQENDPSIHGETDAFRRAGRQKNYRDATMATTLAPCWYCSGLIVQFGIGTVIVGENHTFAGGVEWLRTLGVKVIIMDSPECRSLMEGFIHEHPEIWYEDIGEFRS